MSLQTSEQTADRATPRQLEAWNKIGASYFKGTMSGAMSLATSFDLIKAVNKGEVENAQRIVAEIIAKNAQEREAFKASQSKSVEVSQPSA